MTARQCLALQLYVIAVVRYAETPSPAFKRLLDEQTRSLEAEFQARVPIVDLLTAPQPSGLPDLL